MTPQHRKVPGDFRAGPRPRIWLDIGGQEGNDPERMIADTRLFRDALAANGWSEGDNLSYFEFPGAGHNEEAWAERFGLVLEYLYGQASGPPENG